MQTPIIDFDEASKWTFGSRPLHLDAPNVLCVEPHDIEWELVPHEFLFLSCKRHSEPDPHHYEHA